jgi:hypothetical protein
MKRKLSGKQNRSAKQDCRNLPLNILFVATSHDSFELPNLINSCEEYDTETNAFLKKELDDLVEDSSEEVCLELWTQEAIPKRFWDKLVNYDEIDSHDLDKPENRKLISDNVKKLFPNRDKIIYSTCDPYILGPEFYSNSDKRKEIETRINDINRTFEEKYKLEMTFQRHYKLEFAKFIDFNLERFDIIWVMGCCTPSYVFEHERKFIENFRFALKDEGYLVYSDPVKGHRHGLIDFIKRESNRKEDDRSEDSEELEERNKNYEIRLSQLKDFKKELEVREEGIYQFKKLKLTTIPKK